MTRTADTAAALQRRLTAKYPQLVISVATGTTDVTLAADYDLEGIRTSAYIIVVSCSAGTFTEAIPTKGQTVTSAVALVKMYADDLASDEDRERAAVAATIAATGANV